MLGKVPQGICERFSMKEHQAVYQVIWFPGIGFETIKVCFCEDHRPARK